MIQRTLSHRRAGRGTLIVRASVLGRLANGLAASVGVQFAKPEPPASWVGNPSVLCALDANGSFTVQ
jgi:hypothetical protein